MIPVVILSVLAAILPQQRLIPISIEEMTRRAEVAGEAVVRNVVTRVDPANGMIYTDAFLRFSEVWKGRVDGDVCLTQAGGTIGRTTVAAVGFNYVLEPGQEIVVFAAPSREGRFVTIGMIQGLYRVDPGPERFITRESEKNLRDSSGALTVKQLRARVFRLLGRTEGEPARPNAGAMDGPSGAPPPPVPGAGPSGEAGPGAKGAAVKPSPYPSPDRGESWKPALGIGLILAVFVAALFVVIEKKGRTFS
jgi:hypothetical protein